MVQAHYSIGGVKPLLFRYLDPLGMTRGSTFACNLRHPQSLQEHTTLVHSSAYGGKAGVSLGTSKDSGAGTIPKT